MNTINTYKDLINAFITFLIIGYMNAFATFNIINPLHNKYQLHDIFHEHLTVIPYKLTDYALILYVLYFVVRFIRLSSLQKITKVIWCMNALFTIRLFTFSTTILPPPLPNCNGRKLGEPIIWNVVTHLVNDSSTCVDFMFSGHVAFYMMIMLYAVDHSNYKIEKFFNVIYAVAGMIIVVATRSHYTADVVVAIALTKLIYDKSFNSMYKNRSM